MVFKCYNFKTFSCYENNRDKQLWQSVQWNIIQPKKKRCIKP
jgi:hypothetical protein